MSDGTGMWFGVIVVIALSVIVYFLMSGTLPKAAKPSISSISPDSAVTGMVIAINGSNFDYINDIAISHKNIILLGNTAYLNNISSKNGKTLFFNLTDLLRACPKTQLKPGERCPDIGIGLPKGDIEIRVINKNGESNPIGLKIS
ncbi:MAG: hypothetical protein EPN86_01750 [Nanoarchaeota archaeon]|nr:MAG: hypothetical protein EPN86_01750 [Nanoarchaeota archaeon]